MTDHGDGTRRRPGGPETIESTLAGGTTARHGADAAPPSVDGPATTQIRRADLRRAEQAARKKRGSSGPDTGSIWTGSIPTGSIPTGSIPTGSIPTGSLPTGSLPTVNIPSPSDPPTGPVRITGTPTGGIPLGGPGTGPVPVVVRTTAPPPKRRGIPLKWALPAAGIIGALAVALVLTMLPASTVSLGLKDGKSPSPGPSGLTGPSGGSGRSGGPTGPGVPTITVTSSHGATLGQPLATGAGGTASAPNGNGGGNGNGGNGNGGNGVPAVDGASFYVSPSGSDGNSGTSASEPLKTLGKAFEKLNAGDTLVVGDGTYTEDLDGVSTARGTSSAPITVKAAPGANPTLVGLLWFHDADYWHVSGLNVRWNDAKGKGPHMMKFSGGTGWSYTDAEISGAHAYAAILLTGNTSSFRLANLYIHDTYKTHGDNQDHLIYANADTSGGVIEHCVLADSPNGRAIKIGTPSSSSDVTGNLTIRYNTMYSNLGPSNVQLSYNARNVKIYRNIMVKPSSGTENVTEFNLSGSGNVVYDNLYYQSAGVVQKTSGLSDGGGNVKANPGFVNASGGNFRTTAAAAKGYGRYA